MKIVVDTNVLYSGIFFSGLPGELIEKIADGIYHMVVSSSIVEEYHRIIIERIEKQNSLGLLSSLSAIDALISKAIIIETDGIRTPFCADPDDIKFLQAAIAARAKYLISGDKDLLDVKKYLGGEVIRVRDFFVKQKLH